MKKKLLIFFMVIFITFLTGCSATFDVKIDDKIIIEKSSILMNNSEIIGNDTYYTIEKTLKEITHDTEFLGYYDVVGTKASNPLKGTITYNIESSMINYSLSFCYDEQSIEFNDNILKINTNNYFSCFDKYNMLDNVILNITTDYEVLSSNSDRTKDNTYTWIFNKQTSENKPIEMTINMNHSNPNVTSFDLTWLVFVILIVIILLIGFILFKSKKNNEI